MRRFLGWLLVFGLGFVLGGWFFAGTRWRPLLTPATDGKGAKVNAEELRGLLGSLAVRRVPQVLPKVVMTTKYTIAFVSPRPEARTHLVIVPRRDIKDLGDLRKGDEPYVVDAFAVAGRLARQYGLKRWRFFTRGPGEQDVRYLHFHLLSSENPPPIRDEPAGR